MAKIKTNGSANLNTSQRQALVKLVERAYNRKIEAQKASLQDATAQITREVKEELGILDIEEQLACHESMIKELEAQKEKLGFSKYRSDGAIPGSEAKKLIASRAKAKRDELTALEAEMDILMTKIWTADTVNEVKPEVDALLKA